MRQPPQRFDHGTGLASKWHKAPRQFQNDTVAAMSMALNGGAITSGEQYKIDALFSELDNQVNFLSPYTWQQREQDELAFATKKKNDPDNPTMTEAMASN